MLADLANCCDRIVLTQYQTNPRSFKLDDLIELVQSPQLADALSEITVESFPNPAAALASVLADSSPDDAICITGSAFLVAELRPSLLD